jgi:hypothetical protein
MLLSWGGLEKVGEGVNEGLAVFMVIGFAAVPWLA